MPAFDFTDEDLQANYNHRITERQKQKALSHASDYIWLAKAGWDLFCIFAVVTLIEAQFVGFMVSCVLLNLPLTFIGLVERHKTMSNLRQARIELIEGYSVLYFNKFKRYSFFHWNLRNPETHGYTRCFLEIQGSAGIKFNITIPQYHALRDLQPYKVFYIPTVKYILSIEPLF
ncbi:MAG: hypothetical protein K8L91_33085 [Anaerolineae bacterium]|nr:hypothetical protein [Anaerolineae bacterium]